MPPADDRRRPRRPRRRDDPAGRERDPRVDRPTWGSVARRGAGRLGEEEGPDRATEAWRRAVRDARDRAEGRAPDRRHRWLPAGWVEADVRPEQERPEQERAEQERAGQDRAGQGRAGRGDGNRTGGERRARGRGGRRRPPPSVAAELRGAVGARRAERLAPRLMEAADLYERDRYGDALALLRPLAREAGDAPSVRELHGLVLYRLGRWRPAAQELEAYRRRTGAVDQHPVLADCYRGLGRHDRVEALWDELRAASPSAPLVTEGRIVAAGSLADRGELAAAIALLEASAATKRPKDHHLRLWYALADLHERAGDVPRARELFSRVAHADPELGDAADRLLALG